MYTVTVERDFIAQHFLTVPNAGPENEKHSHHFRVCVTLKGAELNTHGYLVDIVDVEQALERLIDRYKDATLNDLPEFDGLNPSIEHFSRLMCRHLHDQLPVETLEAMVVQIWEDEQASASYSLDLASSSE